MESKFSKFSRSELDLLQRALQENANRCHHDAGRYQKLAEKSVVGTPTHKSWLDMASACEDECCESQDLAVQVRQAIDSLDEERAA